MRATRVPLMSAVYGGSLAARTVTGKYDSRRIADVLDTGHGEQSGRGGAAGGGAGPPGSRNCSEKGALLGTQPSGPDI